MSRSQQQQQQEKAIEHEEVMALHKANARQASQGKSPADQARLLDKVVETELGIDEEHTGLKNLSAKDFPLSNYDEEADSTEFKWVAEILNRIEKSQYPHPRSGMTGLTRAWAAGDTNERKRHISPDEIVRDESYLLGVYSRAVRGEGGFQQETNAKQVTESHAIRESDSRSKGGGLLGRFRS